MPQSKAFVRNSRICHSCGNIDVGQFFGDFFFDVGDDFFYLNDVELSDNREVEVDAPNIPESDRDIATRTREEPVQDLNAPRRVPRTAVPLVSLTSLAKSAPSCDLCAYVLATILDRPKVQDVIGKNSAEKLQVWLDSDEDAAVKVGQTFQSKSGQG